jgi:hypothetical protein
MSALAGTLGGSVPSRGITLSGVLDWLGDTFSGPMVAGVGADLYNPPADLTPEETEAYLDLVASRAESAGLIRDAARRAQVRPSAVVGRVGSPVGPGNNRDRRRVLARLVLTLRSRFADAVRPLVLGAKSLMGWLTGFKRGIAVGHGAAAMLAHGTTAPAPGILATTARWVARQWGYARNFAGQVATGAHVLGNATLARAAMYADSAWGSFMGAILEAKRLEGYTQVRRILGLAEDHCRTSFSKRTGVTTMGCVELAKLGWVPIGEVVPIGTATCLSKCHCRYDFKF